MSADTSCASCYRDVRLPTRARPGSAEKIAILAARAAARLPLHVEGDRWVRGARAARPGAGALRVLTKRLPPGVTELVLRSGRVRYRGRAGGRHLGLFGSVTEAERAVQRAAGRQGRNGSADMAS